MVIWSEDFESGVTVSRLKCPILKPQLMTMRHAILCFFLLQGLFCFGQGAEPKPADNESWDNQRGSGSGMVEESSGWFAFGDSETGRFASVDELVNARKSYKYQVTKDVFDHLVEASGNSNMIRPRLEISPVPRMIAAAKGDDAVILLEEKAYDICASFGADSLNALATLLGHELVHYYEKHNWEDHFIREHQGSSTADQIREKKLANKMSLETQADQLGGLLAHTAGYSTLEIAPELLTRLYTGYNLPATSPTSQYPSLDERKAIAKTSMDRLKELIGVYDLAGYFLATHQFDWARSYYEYILTKGGFQSREIYNNLGVAAALSAMESRKKEGPQFVYPLQLDFSSRMASRGGGADEQTAMLQEALRHFTAAYDLDPAYLPALINMGCVESELGHLEDADDLARKAIRKAKQAGDKAAESDALILTGIIQARLKDADAAKTSFSTAAGMNNPLAEMNLQVLRGESLPPPSLPRPISSDEKIDNYDLDKLYNYFALERFVPEIMIGDIVGSFTYAMASEKASTILVNTDMSGKEIYGFVQVTDPGYSGSSYLGIKVGDSVSKVIEKYDAPTRRLVGIQGEWLVYNDQQIIFRIDRKGNVVNWAVFRIKRS